MQCESTYVVSEMLRSRDDVERNVASRRIDMVASRNRWLASNAKQIKTARIRVTESGLPGCAPTPGNTSASLKTGTPYEPREKSTASGPRERQFRTIAHAGRYRSVDRSRGWRRQLVTARDNIP